MAEFITYTAGGPVVYY